MEGDLDMHVQGASAGSGLAWSWFAVGLAVQLAWIGTLLGLKEQMEWTLGPDITRI